MHVLIRVISHTCSKAHEWGTVRVVLAGGRKLAPIDIGDILRGVYDRPVK